MIVNLEKSSFSGAMFTVHNYPSSVVKFPSSLSCPLPFYVMRKLLQLSSWYNYELAKADTVCKVMDSRILSTPLQPSAHRSSVLCWQNNRWSSVAAEARNCWQTTDFCFCVDSLLSDDWL